jgi:hypothetical protein
LIKHPKFNINEKEIYERTALHFGEYLNIFELIILFILLFKASEKGHYKVVNLLINHPKFNSINEKDSIQRTALYEGEY